MKRREFVKGTVAAALVAAAGRGGAQPAPGTVGEAELDVRQREIDAITPDDDGP